MLQLQGHADDIDTIDLMNKAWGEICTPVDPNYNRKCPKSLHLNKQKPPIHSDLQPSLDAVAMETEFHHHSKQFKRPYKHDKPAQS